MLDTNHYYDEFSTQYEAERHKPYHRFLDQSELAVAAPYCQGKEVLEVGCGTGLVLKPLSQIASRAAGIDISQGMLAKASERGLEVKLGSATDIPFPDASFDTVVSLKVLAHVQDIRKAMLECARVVRPGGHLVLEFYNRSSLRQLVKRLKPAQKIAHSTTDDQVYTRYDSLADIRSYLPEGLDILQVGGIRILAPTYHFFNAPLLGPATIAIEKLLQKTPLRRLGGFLVVVVRKGPHAS